MTGRNYFRNKDGVVMTVPIKIEIQDSRGKVKKRIGADVPEDITQPELLNALMEDYSELIPDTRVSVYVEFPRGRSGTGNLISSGAVVLVRPRSHGITFHEE